MNSAGNIYFISDADFEKCLDSIARKSKVYIPYAVTNREGGTHYPYELYSSDKKFTYFGYRPSHPLKTFLFARRMKVSDYFSRAGELETPEMQVEPVTVVGAAACDIESLKSLDVIFLQDSFTDIFYRERRNHTFFITIDCTKPRETCLCTLAGGTPYPTAGFDLNLSRVEDGYIIEAGSVKGEEVITQHNSLFNRAQDEQLRARDKKRTETIHKVEELNKEYTLSRSRRELLEIQRESDDWFEHVRTCVECGACLFACPTCHCFLLYDQEETPGKYQRIKEWDACVYAGFTRMAGGSSPRLGLRERFRHRYLHKFEYYPKNFGFEACSGCGRCIEGCMGKIDMRKVFKALDTEKVGAQ